MADPRHEADETQPWPNAPERHRRSYVPATWNGNHDPGQSPKVSGGYEVDQNGVPVPLRGLNRGDQRYSQPVTTVRANRTSRAASELATTLVLLGRDGRYEVRSWNGNNYEVDLSARTCDCPDFWRLQQSYPAVVIDCKHIIMTETKVNEAFPDEIYYSVPRVQELTGLAERTVQKLIARGELVAFKTHNVWCIDPYDAQAFASEYASKVVNKETWPTFELP